RVCVSPLWMCVYPFAIRDYLTAIFLVIWFVHYLVGNVPHLALRNQQAADWFRVGHGIDFTLIQCQAQFTRRENLPSDIFSGINAVRSKDPICEDKGRCAHSRNANALTLQIFNRVNIRIHTCLHPKTATVDSSEEPYIKALFDRLKEVHNQVVGDVVAAERECVLVIRPTAFYQFRLESLLLEKALLVSDVNRSFAGQSDVADADFIRMSIAGSGIFSATGPNQNAQHDDGDQFFLNHFVSRGFGNSTISFAYGSRIPLLNQALDCIWPARRTIFLFPCRNLWISATCVIFSQSPKLEALAVRLTGSEFPS